jgi:hypothetical protein
MGVARGKLAGMSSFGNAATPRSTPSGEKMIRA